MNHLRIAAGIFAVGLLFLTACKEQGVDQVEYKVGAPLRSSKDFLIPREVRAQIESKYVEFIRKENPKIILEDAELISRIPREFLDVDVKFRGSSPGVLSSHVAFKLPRGGGLIDLKDYVKGDKGSFYMSFDVRRSSEPEKTVVPNLIYFLSEAKTQIVEGQKYGMGCKQYADITNVILNSNENGFQLNATNRRYVPVLGGVFYFVHFDLNRKIFLSAVRIVDSRYPDMFCDEKLY